MFDTLFCNARIVDGTGHPVVLGFPRCAGRLRRRHSHSERPLLSGEPTDCKTMQGVATEKLGLDGMSPPLCDLSPYSGEVRARTGRAVAGRGHPQDDFANRPARSGWRTRASPCPDLTRISWPSTSGPCWTPTARQSPRPSAGMPHVLENGAFVVGNGVMTGTGPAGRSGSGPLEAVSERRSQDGWFPKRFSYPRTSDCWIKAAWGVDVSRP